MMVLKENDESRWSRAVVSGREVPIIVSGQVPSRGFISQRPQK